MHPAPTPPVYLNPFRGVTGLIPERIDMGVDFGGSGPVYALGDAVITNATGNSAGWPGGGWITYRLTRGPAAGLMVYLAEDVTPTVHVGQHVSSSTVIATMFAGADGIETGWAQPSGASAESQLPEAGSISGYGPFPTRIGLNFEELLQSLGVPAANNRTDAPSGSLPANYPASWLQTVSLDRNGPAGTADVASLMSGTFYARPVANAATAGPGAPVKVACCQIAPRIGEVEANRAACRAAVERAAAAGARIVLLPELAVSGYVFAGAAEARTLAEPADGPTVGEWVDLAGRLGITLVGGFCEAGDDGLLYNSAVVARGGGVQAVYRKAHLWDAEKMIFTPGSEAPAVVEVDGARIAVMICYDLEFPEWVRLPALAGAQLLCVPANWPVMPGAVPAGERAMEAVRAQAAASVNRMFVAVCDRVGHERGVDWVGASLICGPDGWPLAGPAPAHGEAMPVADCQLAAAASKAVSDRNDVLADRRPHLYRGVTEG